MQELRSAIDFLHYEEIIPLLYRLPRSLNDIFNSDFFNPLLEMAKSMETGFSQVKLLYLMQKRAKWEHRMEVHKILLGKIVYLSSKIASQAARNTITVTRPYMPGLVDIDIDYTLEEQPGDPSLIHENLYCHEKILKQNSYVLMLDASNSMRPEKAAVAAIATGVFAGKLRNDFYGVLSFARDTNIIKRLYEPHVLEPLVDKMLDIETGGATNIRKALLDGLSLLNESKTMHKTGILVTDGWATKGGDPVEIAAKFDRLHVLGISFGTGGSDRATNVLMAQKGHGRYRFIQRFDDLPIAIAKIIANK
ncbi:MAG: VWA domain-containing protein [Proteobacteria bacterium]|nr:VWA domain-containing protein [Pseudomonadota bacterium]